MIVGCVVLVKPVHVGVIMDGNRRYARYLMRGPSFGHKKGRLKAREVLSWGIEAGIKYMTAYTLSLENLKSRPKKELVFILNQIGKECDAMLKDKNHPVNKFSVCVRFIGRTKMLPKTLQEKMKKVEEYTKKNKKYFLQIAVAYGGQQEIVDAARKVAVKLAKGIIKPHEIDEKLFRHNLYTNGWPPPDLIIRTGGEKRLSNFLIYQSAYSELIFLDKKWPEFTKKDFNDALKEFESRKRRFGR